MSNETLPDTTPMQTAGTDLVAQAEATRITNAEEAQQAGARLVNVKALVKQIQDAFAAPKKAAHESHKKITGLEADLLQLPKKAESILKQRIGDWQVAENRRIQEEERRLREEARKREEENRIAEAVHLEQSGQAALAEAVIAAPVVAPVVKIEKTVIKGVSTSMKRDFRIVDASKINPTFMQPDMVKIRDTVEALGRDAETVVGGIQFVETPVTRVASR